MKIRTSMTLAFVIATTLAAGSASAPVAMAQGPAQAPGKATAPSPAPAGVKAIDDILDTAAKAGNFKTLAKVLDAADLTKVLKGKGPFTVFAPTDEAFAKLSKEQTEAILDPKNKRWLVSTLGSHVLSGKILKADRIASTKPTYVKMSNGSLVAIDAKDANAIKFGGATITKADIEASNGVIHVIDSVYLPKRVRAALYAIDKAQKAKAAAGPALQKAKEVGGKALDATKDAAGKVIDKGKEVIEKGKEAVGGAPAPAPSK